MSSNKNWENKAKEVYQDGLKVLKEGLMGLEVVAGKTIEVTKLKIANQKSLSKIKNLFVDLGQRVFDAGVNRMGMIKLTPDMAEIMEQIKKNQALIEKNMAQLKKVSTTVNHSSEETPSKSKKADKVKKQAKKAKSTAKKSPPKKKTSKVSSRQSSTQKRRSSKTSSQKTR